MQNPEAAPCSRLFNQMALFDSWLSMPADNEFCRRRSPNSFDNGDNCPGMSSFQADQREFRSILTEQDLSLSKV
jgi:hypothetical protein